MGRGRAGHIVAVLVLAALVAAGCGSSSKPSASSGSSGSTRAADVALDKNAVLRYAYSTPPVTWDPALSIGGFDLTGLFPVYDRLVHRSPDGTLVPGLATKWTVAADGLSIDLTLREGVTFHDGQPFTADAVKANIERSKTLQGSQVAPLLSAIESVDVVGPLEVKLVLSRPDATIIPTLSENAGMMVSPAALSAPDLATKPVGAGPFRFVEARPNDRIVYKAFENYWDPSARPVAGLEILLQPDPVARLNAVRTGAADATFLLADQVPDAESAGLHVAWKSSPIFFYLHLNRGRPPFDDLKVRQALNHAIDRDGLVQGLLFGHGEASVQPFGKGQFGHADDVTVDEYKHDPQLARQLLAEAGHPDGVSFTVVVPAIPNIVQGAEAVQAQLREAGFHVELKSVEPGQVPATFLIRKEGDAMWVPFSGRPDPAQTLFALFHTASPLNVGGGGTPELDALIAAAASTIDPVKREEAIHKAVKAVTDQALAGVAYFPENPTAFSDRVIGLNVFSPTVPELRGVGLRAK